MKRLFKWLGFLVLGLVVLIAVAWLAVTVISERRIAKTYDGKTTRPVDLAENALVEKWLRQYSGQGGRVIDVGCGTGLMVDMVGDEICEDRYLGVDIAEGMVDAARVKHPDYQFECGDIRDVAKSAAKSSVGRFDGLVSLNGSMSYLSMSELMWCTNALLHDGGWFFIMLYGFNFMENYPWSCLLYTSDAADE